MRYTPLASYLRCAILLIAFSCSGSGHLAAEELVRNGNFKEWADKVPEDWEVDIGARNGANEPESEVARLPTTGLLLRGDQATRAWRIVKQELDVAPGDGLELAFEARTKDVRRQGPQYDNCYVGLLSFDTGGKLIGKAIVAIPDDTDGWKKFSARYRVPGNAASTAACVFLSKTGIFGVQSVSVTRAGTASKSDNRDGENNLLKNGLLSEWNGGKPDDWKVEVAARNGANSPISLVKPLPDGGVSLSGNGRTLAWNSVSQSLTVQPGTTYSLRFEAFASGIRREGRQYDNCYVGVLSFDGNDRRVDMAIEDLSDVDDWKEFRVNFSPPRNAKRSEVIVFLSKSGTLQVKSVSVEEATPAKPFR
ncbi:MAG: carbohydrate binding domain-containing protein [Planctomycetota bacterium]